MSHHFEKRDSIVLENEGQKIFGIVHRPLVEEKTPAVLFCHGLGGHKCGKYRVYVELAEHLARIGITVLRLDFRGSGDSEGEFSQMTVHSQISDAQKGLNFLLHDPLVDKNRIGFFGRSLGGAIAVVTAAKFKHAKSMALWAPIYDGKQWEAHWTIAQKKLASADELREMRRINGQVASFRLFEEMFNMGIPEKLKSLQYVPVLHIHGEQDQMVNIQHAENYESQRHNAQAVSKFIRLPNGDHEFTYPEERKYATDITVKWFQETL